MDHERGIDAVEQTLVDEEDLAAPAFLGRAADDEDATAELVGQARGGQTSAQPGGGDDVVPTGVPEARQGVVLAEDRDRRSRGSRPADERGLDAERRALRLDALVLEDRRQRVVG